MKTVLLAASAMAVLGLSACETATPYQPLAAQHAAASGGYSDQQIEANRWRVMFSGNSLTSRETVERYLLFRAAQLTINQGFDWFEAVDRHTDKESSYFDAGVGYGGWGGYWGPHWGLYSRGRGWGYGYWGDPFWGGPVDIQQVSQYQAMAEVVMGHGPKPMDQARAFDARSVIDHLQAQIIYPRPG